MVANLSGSNVSLTKVGMEGSRIGGDDYCPEHRIIDQEIEGLEVEAW